MWQECGRSGKGFLPISKDFPVPNTELGLSERIDYDCDLNPERGRGEFTTVLTGF